MEILTDASKDKDIPSLVKVRELINKVNASVLPCTNKVITEEYQLGTNVQNALNELLDHAYMNATGVKSLQGSMANVWDSINAIPTYTGGSGIAVAGSVISHSNNLSAGGNVNTGEIQEPDFGENASLAWFSYDKQGHVTFTGSGGIKIPTADTALSSSSVRPISSKAVYNNLIASKIRSTEKEVTTGSKTISILDNVQSTLEGFQTHIYNLYTDINSLATNVVSLNNYTNSINKSVGSSTVPVYFKNGVPTVCAYTLGSICAKSTGDYLPITGGTLTGNLTLSKSDVVIPTAKSTVNGGTVPVSGSITITDADFTQLKNFKSIIGTVIDNTNNKWYNVMSVRHRNGYNDGVNYGMYIRSFLTAAGSLVWNKQIAASTWQGERTILDTGNYKTFVTPANIGAAAASHTHSYLPLSGGTLTGNLTLKTAKIITDTDERYLKLSANRVSHYAPKSTGWTTGFNFYNADGTSLLGSISAYGGSSTTLNYYYLGTSYTSPIVKVDTSGNITAKSFVGALSGNATSATKLKTARTINGVSFNGTANITVPSCTVLYNDSTGATTVTLSSASTNFKYLQVWVKLGVGTQMATIPAEVGYHNSCFALSPVPAPNSPQFVGAYFWVKDNNELTISYGEVVTITSGAVSLATFDDVTGRGSGNIIKVIGVK